MSSFKTAKEDGCVPADASNNGGVEGEENLKPQNNAPKLDIKGPKAGTKLDIKGPKTYNIIKRTKNYNYKGKEVFFGVVDNGGKEKLVCFEAGTGVGKGAGLTMAGGSVVADTGEDLIKLLEDVGAINKIAYGMAWTSVKIGELISGRHFSDELEEYYINQLAFGTHKIS